MILWLAFFIQSTDYSISVDLKTLTISNGGSVTRDGVRSKGVYTEIENIIIEDGIETIEYFSFEGCSSLSSVTIPGSCETIGNAIFSKCYKLKSVVFPEGVKNIGSSIFRECSSLEEIYLPSTLESFGNGEMFYTCPKFVRFNINSSNLHFSVLGDGSILVLDQTTAIACSNVEAITFPPGITVINDFWMAYHKVKTLTFTADSQLQVIHDNAFLECSLSKIDLPSNLHTIQKTVFKGSPNLTEISIPASLKSVESDIFTGIPLQKVTIAPGCTIFTEQGSVVYSSDMTSIVFINSDISTFEVPSSTNNIPVGLIQGIYTLTSITAASGGKYQDYLGGLYTDQLKTFYAIPGGKTEVTIHSSCTTVDTMAFRTSHIEHVYFENSAITSLKVAAFELCNIKTIQMPLTVQSIENYCFSIGPLNDFEITFGPSLNYVGNNAFQGSGVKKLNFLQSVNLKSFGLNVFINCRSLVEIVLPPNLNMISQSLFSSCISLTQITIPKGVTSINSDAFKGCTSLSSLTFESGSVLTKIESAAFSMCIFDSIDLPPQLQSIGGESFANNPNLHTVNLQSTQLITLQTKAFANCPQISKVILGTSVSDVQPAALALMNNLMNISVLEGNTHYSSIGGILYSKDFKILVACPGGLNSLYIDADVEQFGQSSFYGCSNLKSITFKPNCPLQIISEQSFFGCSALKEIEIPARVSEIADNVFMDCSGLSKVSFQEGSQLRELKGTIFTGCTSLESVFFPNNSNLQVIHSSTFSGFTSLTSFSFPQSLVQIGSSAFAGCTSLLSIVLGNNIVEIGNNAFEGVYITNIVIPETTTSIGKDCFANCPNLKDVSYCGLSDLSVNASFSGCSKLSSVLVSHSYKVSEFGGLPVLCVYDSDCKLATHRFSFGEGSQNLQYLSSLAATMIAVEDE